MAASSDDPALAATGAPGLDPGDDTLPPGTRVGRYVVLGKLGAGGMGVVHDAFDPELERRVALKLSGTAAAANACSARRRRWRGCATRTSSRCTTRASGAAASSSPWSSSSAARSRDGDRAPRAVMAAFLEAGRGLAAAHAAGRSAAALYEAQRAARLVEEQLGPPELRRPLVVVGVALVALGQAAAAAAPLERALTLGVELDDWREASARFALARALVAAGRDADRSRALAREAARRFERAGRPADAAAVARWLAARA